METRQRLNDVEQSGNRPATDAEVFLAVVRKEHARFIEALGQAATQLGRGSVQLDLAQATQVQLTRQFFDAQRSILQLRAETDKELNLIGSVPGGQGQAERAAHDHDVADQRQQLARVLDEWWIAENELRSSVIAEARSAVERYLARLATNELASVVALSATTTRVLAELETADAADLHSLLDELIHSLDSAPAPSTVPAEPRVAAADELRFTESASRESFGEFWAERELTEPAVAAPSRWRFLPPAVYPVAAVASLLTMAMAWMG